MIYRILYFIWNELIYLWNAIIFNKEFLLTGLGLFGAFWKYMHEEKKKKKSESYEKCIACCYYILEVITEQKIDTTESLSYSNLIKDATSIEIWGSDSVLSEFYKCNEALIKYLDHNDFREVDIYWVFKHHYLAYRSIDKLKNAMRNDLGLKELESPYVCKLKENLLNYAKQNKIEDNPFLTLESNR